LTRRGWTNGASASKLGEFFEDPEGLYPAGAVLPGPAAELAGPTYEEWLNQREEGSR
jgi:hypothetical protein